MAVRYTLVHHSPNRWIWDQVATSEEIFDRDLCQAIELGAPIKVMGRWVYFYLEGADPDQPVGYKTCHLAWLLP